MNRKLKSVCIVSPFPPPYGGMAIQAEKFTNLLKNKNIDVIGVRTNQGVPRPVKFFSRIPGIRTIIGVLVFLRHLRKALPKSDIVYMMTGFRNFFMWVTIPAVILVKLHGKKIILSSKGGGADNFFSDFGFIVRPVFRMVDGITTPSGFLRDVIKKHFDIEPVVIPNIVDIEQFSFREKSRYRPRLLVTRILRDIYDIPGVIKTFQIVQKKFPEARLGIVGQGPLRKQLEQMVKDLTLEEHVTFYGEVHHSEIQELYNEYDILVNASTVDNLPGVILEAFSIGLPVVSTNAGGIPYLVTDGVTGFLSDIGDYQGLAENVIRIVEHPEMVRNVVNSAWEACRIYTKEHVASILIPYLEKVLERSR